jgi:ubiquinone/menaquinone biosynthesis C-methylase UbiE
MKDSSYSDPELADAYDRVAARYQFREPARDLVGIVGLSEGGVVLDIGTGTGLVAAAARRAVGPAGTVVAVDPSIEMIGRARSELAGRVLARVPGLPFSNESFDAVVAGFAVSHFDSHLAGLSEMARVCRAGGRVAMSAWGSMVNPAAALWSDVAAEYIPRQQLQDAFLKQIPWDTWLSHADNVASALQGAGLDSVSVETRCYAIRMPIRDYLISREASVQGLVLRHALSASRWRGFTQQAAEAFQNKFGAIVEYPRDVHFGVGSRQ